MAWIESHQELAQHPKTRRLVRALGVSLPTAIGHLHMLWWWAMDYADQGDLTAYSDEDIADAVAWDGDARVFVTALRTAGFLNEDRTIHDWRTYVGRLLDKRRADAERKRRERGQPPLSNGQVALSSGHPPDDHGTAPGVQATAQVNRNPNLVPEPLPRPETGDEETLSAESGQTATAVPPPRTTPKPNKSQEVVELLAAQGIGVDPRLQDRKTVKECGASAEEIAACYAAIYHEEFGDDFMRRGLSLQSAVGHLGGYRQWRDARASPKPKAPPMGKIVKGWSPGGNYTCVGYGCGWQGQPAVGGHCPLCQTEVPPRPTLAAAR